MRHALLAISLLALGCGAPPAVEPPPPAEETPQPEPEQPKPLPEVWGPVALADKNPDPAIVEVDLVAKVGKATLASGTTIDAYTFNGRLPGPLLQARKGDRVIVHFKNELPEPTTIHWHGLRIPEAMDGSPRIQNPVKPGESFDYDFVVPDQGAFWYHPHVRTNEQVEKGLYGPIIVRGDVEPAADVERYLLLDDVLLESGSIAPFMGTGMEMMHGRYGNNLLTNGRINGDGLKQAVSAGTVERWRIVNTANARTMSLSVEGASFTVVGTDGGPLPLPYQTARLEVPVGQRYDLLVNIAAPGTVKLQSWVLTTNAQNQTVEVPITVFSEDVTGAAATPKKVSLPDVTAPQRSEDGQATMVFDAVNDPQMGIMFRINGVSMPRDPLFTFKKGQTVRLTLSNNLGMEHPFHLHGQFFTILKNGQPDQKQPGLKDTVLVPGGQTVEVKAYLDNPGRWMAHCHILEHAELGMMAEIVVAP